MTKKMSILFIIMIAIGLAACGGSAGGEEVAAGPVATDTPSLPAGDPVEGEQLFTASCSSCHGVDAKGVPGVGKDLTSGEFIPGMSNEEFLEFVKIGRPSSHPDNSTGIDMPPKGGNPALTDEQILDIIAYLRSIHE